MLLAVLIFLLDVAASVWSIYLFPVNEGDSLAYHLQSAPNWYQAKNLITFPTNDFRNLLFPDNQNFLVLWNFLSFKNDSLIEIIPYLYLLLSVLIIFNFLQKFQKNTYLNFLLSLLFYFVGTHFIYAKTFSGDTAVAAFTLASLTMLYSYIKSGNSVYFFFFSISNGLLLGTKIAGFLDVAVLYSFAFLYESFFRKDKRLNTFIKYLPSLAICFTLGGFRYFENWQQFHNPLYPKRIDLFGLVSLPGISAKLMGDHGFNPIRAIYNSSLFAKSFFQGAFGYQFPLFYIPAILTMFLFFRKKISKMTYFVSSYILISNVIFLLIFLAASTRYFFDIGFLGIIFLANLLKAQRKDVQSTLTALFAFFILFSALESGTLLRFGELYDLSKKPLEERQLGGLFYDEDFYFFQKNVPVGATILYLLPENSLIYPFYGPRYENRLLYANTYDTDEIIEKVKKERVEIIIAKSATSTYGSYFYGWDFKSGALIEFPEEYAKNAVAKLLQAGHIKEIGQSSRLAFYQVDDKELR
ncbi:MAG: hypothetical protein Q7S70_00750 [bacterium]|nr:hypothetical protein [bacterium]